MYDAVFQSLCYWAMGALSNEPATMCVYMLTSSDLLLKWAIVELGMLLYTRAPRPLVALWHGES